MSRVTAAGGGRLARARRRLAHRSRSAGSRTTASRPRRVAGRHRLSRSCGGSGRPYRSCRSCGGSGRRRSSLTSGGSVGPGPAGAGRHGQWPSNEGPAGSGGHCQGPGGPRRLALEANRCQAGLEQGDDLRSGRRPGGSLGRGQIGISGPCEPQRGRPAEHDGVPSFGPSPGAGAPSCASQPEGRGGTEHQPRMPRPSCACPARPGAPAHHRAGE
jgi:hypothetical protein